MEDKNIPIQIIGSLMKHPQFLSQSDKYNLSPDDFDTKLYKFLFRAIENLYKQGANRIAPADIESYFQTIEVAKTLFERENGVEFLQDCEYLADDGNFDVYYKRLKKFNLLRELGKEGFQTKEFYNPNLADPAAIDTNARFEELEIGDIIDEYKKKILKAEKDFSPNEATETRSAFDGMEQVLVDAEEGNDIGLPLQGAIFNEVVAGARKGCLYIRSAASSVGKSRSSVADCCLLAFPTRYEPAQQKWIQTGNCQKVLYIATEQDFGEIQRMILSYLTAMPENRLRYGNFNEDENRRLRQAMAVLEKYKDNLFLVRMPNPTIALIKTIIRENCLTRGIEYVAYDYIFIGPALLAEFKGFALRNDELLLLMATALKDLAVELNVFILTATQLNAKGDENENIRNEASLAGGRATINKADVGVIMARPTKEELEILGRDLGAIELPNLVSDVYKVRSGQYTQVRIWSYMDLGILRKKDLFITDARLQPLNNFSLTPEIADWEEDEYRDLLVEIERINEIK